MNPLQLHMAATASWFAAFGVQQVLFAWLLTIQLHETPERVGIAQMSVVLPSTLFLLLGGILADQYGGRRIAVAAQLFAIAPLALLLAAVNGWIPGGTSFSLMLLYGSLMGTAAAFVTPSRDGLINVVARTRVQRAVVLVSLMQFGFQMVGFAVASQADRYGPTPLIAFQGVVLLLGAVALSRIEEPPRPVRTAIHPVRQLSQSLLEGSRIVFGSPAMRAVLIINCGMGSFFMGSYIVSFPLLVREVYDGSSPDLALLNTANSLGLVSTILLLVRYGDVRRQGRALVLSHLSGGIFLAMCGLGLPFWFVLMAIFGWGACGGIAMSMARTIMQELAPEDMRGRVMSFYSFSFIGSGPIGALLSGALCQYLGAANALMVSASAMFVLTAFLGLFSSLWRVKHQPLQAAPNG